MEKIIDILVNNGVAVATLAYFIFRDYKFMGTLNTTLNNVQLSLKSLDKAIDRLKKGEK